MKTEFPECGRIVNTHGCRGGVKIESYCDAPEVLARLPRVYRKTAEGYMPYTLLSPRVHSGAVITGLSGVTTMNDAEALKGTLLYAKREDIPMRAGAVLLCDVIGLSVIDADTGKLYGVVIDAERGVASDLYTIRTDTGEVLFPAVPAFIKEIDTERGIFVQPVSGLFDEL